VVCNFLNAPSSSVAELHSWQNFVCLLVIGWSEDLDDATVPRQLRGDSEDAEEQVQLKNSKEHADTELSKKAGTSHILEKLEKMEAQVKEVTGWSEDLDDATFLRQLRGTSKDAEEQVQLNSSEDAEEQVQLNGSKNAGMSHILDKAEAQVKEMRKKEEKMEAQLKEMKKKEREVVGKLGYDVAPEIAQMMTNLSVNSTIGVMVQDGQINGYTVFEGHVVQQGLLDDRKKMYVGLFGIVFASMGFLTLLVNCFKPRETTYEKLEDSQRGVQLPEWLAPVCVVYVLVFLAMCTLVPLHGSVHASCNTGLLWEDHAVAFGVIMFGKFLEVILFAWVAPCAVGCAKLLIRFGTSTAAMADIYTDFCFVVIAHSCASFLWMVALAVLIMGVVLLQFCATLTPWTWIRCTSGHVRNTDQLDWAILKLASMEVLAEFAPNEGNGEFGPSNAGPAFTLAAAVVRFACEDLAQTTIQVVFVLTVGKNPQVFISIGNLAFSTYMYFKNGC